MNFQYITNRPNFIIFNSLTQPSILRKLPFIGKYFRGEEEVQYTVPAHQEPLKSTVAGGHHLRNVLDVPVKRVE